MVDLFLWLEGLGWIPAGLCDKKPPEWCCVPPGPVTAGRGGGRPQREVTGGSQPSGQSPLSLSLTASSLLSLSESRRGY